MKNLEKYLTLLDGEVDGLLLTSRYSRHYGAEYDIAEGVAVVSKKGCRYFTDNRYTEAAENGIKGFEVLDVAKGGEDNLSMSKSAMNAAIGFCAVLSVSATRIRKKASSMSFTKLSAKVLPNLHGLPPASAVMSWDRSATDLFPLKMRFPLPSAADTVPRQLSC